MEIALGSGTRAPLLLALRTLVLAAALALATAPHAAIPSPRAKTQALLLERDFESLADALRKQVPSPTDAERYFTLALTKLDADSFYRLYEVAPESMKREAMTVAAHHGRVDLLEGLVKRGLDPAAARGRQGSVVTTAARAGKVNVIEWALKSGVAPLPEDAQLNELAAASSELAAYRKADKAVYAASAFRWLESRGFKPPAHPDTAFTLTSNLLLFGDVALLDRYVRVFKTKNLFDPNATRGGIPLVYSTNSVAALKYLEGAGAKLDVPSGNEMAEKMLAIMSGILASRPSGSPATIMVQEMAEPTRRVNPLENRELDRDARFYLLSKGLRPHGDALLHVIQTAPPDFALVEAMLKAGADPNGRPESRCGTLLSCVARETASDRLTTDDARKLISLLVRAGADKDRVSRGVLPIHNAVMGCNWNAIKPWLDMGYDVNAAPAGHTVLAYHALYVPNCDNPTADVIRQLARAGADANAGTRAPLLNLVESRLIVPIPVFDGLLDAGANVNASDANGTTALHLLVSREFKSKPPCPPGIVEEEPCAKETVDERAQLLRHLVARGADPVQPNKKGVSALEAARNIGDETRRQAYLDALSTK